MLAPAGQEQWVERPLGDHQVLLAVASERLYYAVNTALFHLNECSAVCSARGVMGDANVKCL